VGFFILYLGSFWLQLHLISASQVRRHSYSRQAVMIESHRWLSITQLLIRYNEFLATLYINLQFVGPFLYVFLS